MQIEICDELILDNISMDHLSLSLYFNAFNPVNLNSLSFTGMKCRFECIQIKFNK